MGHERRTQQQWASARSQQAASMGHHAFVVRIAGHLCDGRQQTFVDCRSDSVRSWKGQTLRRVSVNALSADCVRCDLRRVPGEHVQGGIGLLKPVPSEIGLASEDSAVKVHIAPFSHFAHFIIPAAHHQDRAIGILRRYGPQNSVRLYELSLVDLGAMNSVDDHQYMLCREFTFCPRMEVSFLQRASSDVPPPLVSWAASRWFFHQRTAVAPKCIVPTRMYGILLASDPSARRLARCRTPDPPSGRIVSF